MAAKSEKYELFYSNSSVYSNFYPAGFTDPELMRRIPDTSDFCRKGDFTFVHVEQYMHACKVGAITMSCNVLKFLGNFTNDDTFRLFCLKTMRSWRKSC